MVRRRDILAASGSFLLTGCLSWSAESTNTDSESIDCQNADGAWPMYGQNPARTSQVVAGALPDEDSGVRRIRTGSSEGDESFKGSSGTTSPSGIEAPPAIDEGIAYLADSQRIEARDINTDEQIWEVIHNSSVSTTPVLACDSVYVTTIHGTIAMDRTDGTILWETENGWGTHPSKSPIVTDGSLYEIGRKIAVVDAETGDETWSTATERLITGLAVDDLVYVCSSVGLNGAVTAFTPDGDQKWETTVAEAISGSPAVADGSVYVTSSSGQLLALDASDGTVRWQSSIEKGVYSPPATASGTVVVDSGNGSQARAFDSSTGDRRWEVQTGSSSGSPTIISEYVLLGSATSGIHVCDLETGERLWKWPVEDVHTQVVVADGRLVCGSRLTGALTLIE